MKTIFRGVAVAALLAGSLGAGVARAEGAAARPTVLCLGGHFFCSQPENTADMVYLDHPLCEQYFCALFDQNGYLVGEPKSDVLHINAFSDYGLASFVNRERETGVVDRQNREVVAAKFSYIGRFADNGLAAASPLSEKDKMMDAVHGFIDGQGNWVIEPRFIRAEGFQANGLSVASEQGFAESLVNPRIGLINARGEWVLEPVADSFQYLPKPYSGEAMSPDGAFNRNPILRLSANGDMAVSVQRKWGLLDKNGQWLIEPRFDELRFDGDTSWMAASENDRWGVVNAQGQWLVEPQFDNIGKLAQNGLALAQTDAGDGFINREGQWVIAPQRARMRDFSDAGLAAFRDADSGRWGFINAAGEVVIAPKFAKAHDFINGMAQIRTKRGARGFIHPDGSWAIAPEEGGSGYQFNTDMAANGVVLTQYQSRGWGVLGKDGEWKLGPGLNYFPMYDHNNLIATRQDGFPVSEIELMSIDGEKVAHFSYGCGYAELIDRSGKVAWSNGSKPAKCTEESIQAETMRRLQGE